MKILAITACPSGVAHTYMAANALKKAAQELGHEIKVETQGAFGIENELKANEIKEAAVIIFAVDTKVTKEERFAGKIIHRVTVSEPITNAKKVISDAISKVV
ncbi:PTS fructose transporter subunit IIB [Caloramator australicus]|uniref:PTS system, fructose-specific IIA component / PTS system, fructose-specific IIB component / PTS system,fructose-specific IIC component n=1 Tax=Caloramator australicus RC3 TaxID=857293 RepID=I7K6L4_9CLOT|nr:PTS fructose transporter subunit IIB [Caloramator australicus]CCJ33189.1 PTS system, fructose-specific IIA component / PTS system, fructose-specific IIB component / PTS system,fructose-specific IIC component [Caloramator australicus RC3]